MGNILEIGVVATSPLLQLVQAQIFDDVDVGVLFCSLLYGFRNISII
jgi:hypothetical protein